ncbi:MAG: acyltransferase family protein [Thermodesulfobacteriota bacterium]
MQNFEQLRALSYIPGIAGLRAVAVMAVILYHLQPEWLPGGYAGVDIFFVISGYVVSLAMARHRDLRLSDFLFGFYARRMVRILPALIVCMLVTVGVTILFVPPSWLSDSIRSTGLWAFFGIGNLALVRSDDGYFSPRVEFNPFTHTWSLGVEEQFYLLFPLIFFFWWRESRHREGRRRAVLHFLEFTFLASLGYCWYLTAAAPSRAYYLLPGRFWELAAGALLFRCHFHGRGTPADGNKQRLLLSAGVILVALGMAFAARKGFPFPWAVPVVVGTMCGIAALAAGLPLRPSMPQRLLESRLAAYLGAISFSLYLWHWPVLALGRWTTGVETPVQFIVVLLVTVMFAVLSYHWVESPIRRRRYPQKIQKSRVVPLGLVAVLIGFAASSLLFRSQHSLSLSTVIRQGELWYPNGRPSQAVATGSFRGRTLFALGDSHTGAYDAMLQQLQTETGARVVVFTKGGCGVAALQKPVLLHNPDCREFVDDSLERISSEAAPGDVVFLASLRMPRFGDQWGLYPQERQPRSRDTWKVEADRALALEEATAVMERLASLPVTMLISAPTPIFKAPPFRCSDWFNRDNPACRSGFTMTRQDLDQDRQPVLAAFAELRKRFPSLRVWDPFPILCPGEVCSAFDDAGPLFFDGDHLSGHGNRVLSPAFRAMLEDLWGAEKGSDG